MTKAPLHRYLMRIAYDGNGFHGWQVQPHKRTVQRVVEKALRQYTGKKTDVTASGRTDAGVHAVGQYAHFDTHFTITGEQMRKGIRKYLPDDVMVTGIYPVDPAFHARYDANLRHYVYVIARQASPFNRLYSGHFPRHRIDTALINVAIPYLLGEHDFSSFSKPNPAIPDHVCEVTHISFEEYDTHYVFTIKATRFLHNMVRRIVGALLILSQMSLPPQQMLTWLQSANPRQTLIFPVPPQGLYLMDVRYPQHLFTPPATSLLDKALFPYNITFDKE